MPGLGRNLFSTALAAQKGVKTVFTKAGFIVDLDLLSIQLTRSDNLDHLDLAVSEESKRTESACCAISGKVFHRETLLLTASVPQKPIALSSAVGQNNISPTCRILHNLLALVQKLAVTRKITLRRLWWLTILIKGVSKSSDNNVENEYDVIQNVKITGWDNVGNDDAVKNQHDTLTLRFIEKGNDGDLAREKNMNCKHPTEKQLGASLK